MRRWLCTWLALLVVLQVAASALAGLHGSLHRHRSGAAASTAIAPMAGLRWEHAKPDAQRVHRALHASGEWHAHDLHDTSVVSLAAEVAADALAQLAAAFAPAQRGAEQELGSGGARHALPSTASWWAGSRAVAPPLKPPRA